MSLSMCESLSRYKHKVEYGDTVLVYLGLKNIYPLKVSSGEVFQTKYGALRHDDIIGKEYGSVVYCPKGWVHILHNTPELWTLTLPHRTQILYTTDISIILTQLDLKSGSIVCEAGTGSGSLSHAIARTIAPNGHLYTFDFHKERVETAKDEFKCHRLDHVITVEHRDVCSDGFGVNGIADALFLDIPHPWEAIPFAKIALKSKGSRICTFSPCIEQVQKTCISLRECQFVDIETFECISKPYEVKHSVLPVYNFKKSQSNDDDDNSKRIETSDDNVKRIETSDDNVKRMKSDNDGSTPKAAPKEYNCAIPINQITGHTGFLTTATKA